MREAQYNLAQVPFKKKDYATAQERFEALFKQTPGGDKNQASELIKFKIYLTLLLEGKESRAQAMMEQFQFTGDTPALYYAQAAWEFKHNNPEKAADWTASAKKIYSPALNSVFADAFYDLGWMQGPEVAAAAAPAVEPSPIPDGVLGANKQKEESKGESVASLSSASSPLPTAIETTSGSAQAEQPPVSASPEPVTAQTSGQSAERPGSAVTTESTSGAGSAATTASPFQAPTAPPGSAAQNERPSARQTSAAAGSAVKVPQPALVWSVSRPTWLVGGMLLAGIFLLAWVVVPELRRYTFSIPSYLKISSFTRSRVVNRETASPKKEIGLGGFFGGPRHVSVRLAPAKVSLGRTVLPSANSSSGFHRVVDVESKSPLQTSAYSKMEADGAQPFVGGEGG